MIVPQTVSITSPTHHKRGIHLYHMNYYVILKERLQVIHTLHPKKSQVAIDKLLVLKFPWVEVETSFPIRFVLFTDT